ncbi:MAG TPA: YfiR family protein [Burkholderiales bacterium]|nr:YfiR family protein [Burkholderiales bacterium]
MSALRFLALAAMLALGLSSAHAQPVEDEELVKAAFLLRFVQYVQWPQDGASRGETPITIGVARANGLAAKLTRLVADRGPGGRKVDVRVVNSPEDLASVELLFVGGADPAGVVAYANATTGRGVLVVTEATGALEHGSMINFVLVDRRVRFEIAPGAAEKSGLVVSSRLLAVAVRVHRGAAQPELYYSRGRTGAAAAS